MNLKLFHQRLKTIKGLKVETPAGKGRVYEIHWNSEQIMIMLEGDDFPTTWALNEIEGYNVTNEDSANVDELNFN